jgi:hypothetical protein
MRDGIPILQQASGFDKIHQMQEQQILSDTLELLDLEDLQGVSGLKALRVGVTLNTE